MRRLTVTCFLTITCVGLVAPAAPAQQPVADWDFAAVERAIERAAGHLWSRWDDGHWRERSKPGDRQIPYGPNHGGITALCAYALLTAGEDPQGRRMKQTLEWLAGLEMEGTYARAMRANVWAALGRDSKYRKHLEKDVAWLVRAADERGAYDYTRSEKAPARGRRFGRAGRRRGRFDNSNSQLAVLGVWAGQRSGIETSVHYWRAVERHWRGCQNDDGGWAYQDRGRPSYGSMTVAGLATLFICFDAVYAKQFVRCRADTDYEPVVRGLAWLDKHFSVEHNPGRGRRWYEYYLYGVERVGLASGYKYFGKKDWYKLGAKALVDRRGWSDVTDAAFALLFLARGQNPVLFNKLKYPGTWNCRPRDLANLTRWITGTFEKPVNWQIIHLGVPVSEWHDAPVLYVSGATAPDLTDEHLDALKRFIEQGGVILSEAACSRTAFTMAMNRFYARMFPGREMERLGDDHPIYDLHFKIDRGRTLWGISNGVRLLVIHSPAQLSLAWQSNEFATRPELFRLGANVYFFVSDKGSLRKRGVSHWPRARAFTPVETLRVARVKHAGNHDPEPLAWKRFAVLMGNRHRVKVVVSEPMALTALDAVKWPVAAMTGTGAFELAFEERQALTKYFADGGTMLVDAAGGSEAFAKAAETQFRRVLPEADYGLIPSNHALFRKVGPIIERVHYRRALRKAVYDDAKPRLRGLARKGRLAVILSPDDLTAGLLGYQCWGLAGYTPESAFDIVRNAVLFASGKTLTAGGG